MAVLQDPSGAIFCIWEAGARQGAQLVNEPQAWAMSLLNTRDVGAAKKFYGTLFGWETETFDAGGTEVTLWRLPGYVGGEPDQPVARDVVGAMAPMGGEAFPDEAQPARRRPGLAISRTPPGEATGSRRNHVARRRRPARGPPTGSDGRAVPSAPGRS